MLAVRGRLLSKVPAATVRLPGVVAAGAAAAGLILIVAGVWSINRSAGMISGGVALLVLAVGWARGSQ